MGLLNIDLQEHRFKESNLTPEKANEFCRTVEAIVDNKPTQYKGKAVRLEPMKLRQWMQLNQNKVYVLTLNLKKYYL